jgi:hypothetical protein
VKGLHGVPELDSRLRTAFGVDPSVVAVMIITIVDSTQATLLRIYIGVLLRLLNQNNSIVDHVGSFESSGVDGVVLRSLGQQSIVIALFAVVASVKVVDAFLHTRSVMLAVAPEECRGPDVATALDPRFVTRKLCDIGLSTVADKNRVGVLKSVVFGSLAQ